MPPAAEEEMKRGGAMEAAMKAMLDPGGETVLKLLENQGHQAVVGMLTREGPPRVLGSQMSAMRSTPGWGALLWGARHRVTAERMKAEPNRKGAAAAVGGSGRQVEDRGRVQVCGE